jgi:hypothetical protein
MCTAVVLGAMTVTSFAQAPAPGGAGGGGGGGGRQGRGGGQGRQGGFGRGLTVVSIPAGVLQGELGLSTDQTAKIAAIQTKMTKERTALMPAPEAGQPFTRPTPEVMQQMTDLNTKATADINAILSEDQKAKLPAAIKNLQVYQGLQIPLEVLPEVKFSADQKKQIAAIAEEHTKAVADAQANSNGDRQAAQAARTAANTASQAKLMMVISPEQKAAIEKYIAAHPRPQFGGGGNGRRGGGGAAPGGA